MKAAFKSLLGMALSSLLLAGCVSISGLYQDPSFTYEAVALDHVGVGGVVSTVIPLSQPQQIAYSGLLRNGFQDIASVYMQTQIEKSHDYPTPPSENELLASIFSDFMTKFPKQQN